MVGIQGSGKSFVAEHYLKRANYEVVSNDKSGGRDKVTFDVTAKPKLCPVLSAVLLKSNYVIRFTFSQCYRGEWNAKHF